MFRGILNVPFLGVAILWLLLLANPIEGRQGVIQARAGPNYLSHARERMWLYDVYDIMWYVPRRHSVCVLTVDHYLRI